MSVLVVGLSHRSAPVELLERAAVGVDEIPKLLDEMLRGSHVTEVMMLSTCNRIEVYAVVDAFHGGLADVSGRARPARRAAAARAHRAPLRALRGLGGAAPVRRRRGAGLDGDRRGADPRPAARRLRRRGRRGHGRAHAARAVAAGAARRQAGARPHRHRRRGRLGRLRGARRRRGGARPRSRRRAGRRRRRRRDGRARRRPPAPRAAPPRSSCSTARAERARAARPTTPGGPAPRPAPPRSRRCADELADGGPAGGLHRRGRHGRRPRDGGRRGARADGRPLAVCDLGLPRDVDPGVAALPGVTVVDLVALQARLAAARARRGRRARPRSWSPRRRRPTSPRSARPRSPRR